MMWIDLSSDKNAKVARLNWRSRKHLRNWNYDEEGQAIFNRIIEHSGKGKSWRPYMNRPLKHKGRWKTRGGRDQDRWRGDKGDKERSRRKCREVCRQIDFEWNCRVQVCGDCFGDSMSGALQLGNNPDCDSVKWIKAGVYDVSDYSADAAAEKMKGGE